MSSSPKSIINLFVDGNYLFFSARGAGLNQDFNKLESNLLTRFGGAERAQFGEKHFYTRPPQDTDPKAVLGWLKNHSWSCIAYNYTSTHQDSLYVAMVHDMWFTYLKARELGTLDDTYFVVVSGSGTLIHPLKTFPKVSVLACIPESTSKRLMELTAIVPINLVDLLK